MARMRPPRYSIALLSATSLAYELLLIRMFSIIQWHHFAYMIISLALLGYGASGSFLSLAARRLLPRFATAYISNAFMFGVSTLICCMVAQRVSFNPEEILWDIKQPLRLFSIYIVLAVPFFFVANCIGLALTRHRNDISGIYSADLLGACIGSFGIVLLLFMLFPSSALQVIGCLGIAAAGLAWWELGCQPRRAALILVLLSFFPLMLPSGWLSLTISPYKGMNQSLQISGARIIDEYSSPLGLISVMENPQIPFRHVPGLSLNAAGEPPDQLAVFNDADAVTVITKKADAKDQLAYLDYVSSALPYHVAEPQSVLILGAGGGADVLQAKYQGAGHVDAVELNPQVVDLVREVYDEFAGGIYSAENTSIHIGDARGFVSGSRRHYDLIIAGLMGSAGATSAGLYSLSENYLFTVQALVEYISRLSEHGIFAISSWVKLPPRDTLKLFATAVDALRQSGFDDPENRLILIRGWQTSTLLIKQGRFDNDQIHRLKDFCSARSFDTAYFPGIQAADTNQYNILSEPYFFHGAQALLGNNADDFIDNYKFNLQPASDDQPYFSHFFKWGALKEILALRGQGGMPLIDWGYLIIIATLLQAALASLVLIVLPLLFSRYKNNNKTSARQAGYGRVGSYFFLLGIAFLFIEIAFIQRFILFLHHPLYATAVVLACFLFFAGLGSAWSRRYHQTDRYKYGVDRAVMYIVLLGLIYVLITGHLFSILNWLPFLIKVVISIMLIGPLAFCMGMPFPLGLARLGKTAPGFIPWAWGVNGCASVLSAVLATLLAVHFGFRMVVILAILLYLLARVIFNASWRVL